MLDEKVSALIGRVYESAVDEAAWSAVLQDIREATGHYYLMFSVVDLEQREYSRSSFYGLETGRALTAVDEYTAHYYRTDPTLQFGARNPRAGRITLAQALVDMPPSPDLDEYMLWYRSAFGATQSLVCYGPPVGGLTVGLSFHRGSDGHVHDADAIRLCRMLADHAERAVRIAARHVPVDGASDAVIHIGADGTVREMSDAAHAIVGRGDGLSVTQGQLTAALRTDQAALDAALRSALSALVEGTAGGSVRIMRPSGAPPLAVSVRPLLGIPSPAGPLRPRAELRIVDPEATLSPERMDGWRTNFDLTPAEARLAGALFDGDGSLRDAAARRGIAYGTARVQLASIFAKTGVHTQAQLMRLLIRLH